MLGDEAPRSVRRKARDFAKRWADQVETATEAALWSIAARTWNDKARNELLWTAILDGIVGGRHAAPADAGRPKREVHP